jgi:dihydrofolate reductase
MRKLVVTMFVSVDGVIEEPHLWVFPFWNDAITKFKRDELFATDTLLLGRVTYDVFAASWPSRKHDEFADRMNSLPKVVVSTTLGKAEWNNSTIIGKNIRGEVAALKQQPGQEIVVHGSPTLVATLMEHGLIDEYRLLTFPIVLGSGKRLFAQGSKASLKLLEAKSFDSGAILLRYQPEAKKQDAIHDDTAG